MLKKITSLKDIQTLEKGDIIRENGMEETAKEYKIHTRLTDDLIVDHQNGELETRLLTQKDLLTGSWWVRK
jgi:hypothetical protein